MDYFLGLVRRGYSLGMDHLHRETSASVKPLLSDGWNASSCLLMPGRREGVSVAGLGVRRRVAAGGPQGLEGVSTALEAAKRIDAPHARLYLDFLRGFVRKNVPELLENTVSEDPMKDMLGYEYETGFAKRYCAQGLAEGLAKGRVEGQRELILKQLQQLFGPLSGDVRAYVHDAQDLQLEKIALGMLTAHSPEQLLSSLG
jgi:hypothetical protein